MRRFFDTFVPVVCVWAVLVLLAMMPAAHAQILVQDGFPNLANFTRPVDLQNAGDGSDRLFVVEQAGRVWVFQNDPLVTQRKLFLGIIGRVDSSDNEEGLLGLAFHPAYPDSPYVYVNYTTTIGGDHTQISRYTVTANPDSADATNDFSIIEIPKPASNHNAGQIAFGPDGYLYIGTGDGGGGGDPFLNGQDRTTLLGSMLRIDVDNQDPGLHYAIPGDNPFAGNLNGYREEIWAWGFRNPWRFSFDSATDSLWLGDVGQGLWEEIDVVRKGENYGWNQMEGNHCYVGGCNPAAFTTPIWEYFHESGRRSITGGHVYRGTDILEIVGRYIYADYSTGEIWSLEWNGVDTANVLLIDVPAFVSSFGVDEANELYFTTLFGGRVMKLVDDQPTAIGDQPPPTSAGRLEQNVPNPFNPETVIHFTISQRAFVELSVYDVHGKLVRNLVNSDLGPGPHRAVWAARDRRGGTSPSGVYFYTLKLDGSLADTRRMVLLQ
jgi:glucose/arabinose dehydrogenase